MLLLVMQWNNLY